MKVSPIFETLPSTPPEVTTSSPLASASIIALCSFCRFICGRIITKYSTTNISTSGSMLPRPPNIESAPAAGAAWAKASEMNTGGNPSRTPARPAKPVDCRGRRDGPQTPLAAGAARGAGRLGAGTAGGAATRRSRVISEGAPKRFGGPQ